MKTRMQIVQEGARTVGAKNALRQIQELKSIVNDMRAKKVYGPNIQEVEAQGLLAIKNELLAASKMESERISKRLSQLESEYRKSKRESPVDYSEIRAHYAGMGDDELRRVQVEVLSSPKGRDPTALDYLSSELRLRGLETATIRKTLNNNNYMMPWTHSPEGQALSRESSFYAHAKPGDFLVEANNQMGEASTVAVSVEGLYYE